MESGHFTEIGMVDDSEDDPMSYNGTQLTVIPHYNLLRLYVMFLLLWQSLFRLSDTGANVLLAFLSTFLLFLTSKVGSDTLMEFCQHLPKTICGARKLAGRSVDEFQKWVCCPTCKSLYAIDECKKRGLNGKCVSKQCGFVRYPNHVQAVHRKPCGKLLLRQVRTASTLYPNSVYCYNSLSLIKSLSELVQRPDFFKKSEAWRSRTSIDGYSDI